MSELPHVDSFDPEDGGGLAPPSKSENSGATDAAHEEARPVEPVELDISDPNFMADAYDTHPYQLAKFKADPELAKGVVEETLRYWGPVDFIGRRIAKEDVEVGGTVIPSGEQATVSLASANRDPGRFANPDVFDITRADANRHLAFGKGIHVCLGAPLARVEGQVAFDTLFRRFPELRLAVPAEEVRWGSSFLRGFARLPVLF